MNDAALVRVVERVRNLGSDLEHLERLQHLVLLDAAQGLPLDVRHHEKQVALEVREIVDRDDSRMIELGDGAGLALEPFALISLEIPGSQHLDRYVTVENGVAGEVNDSHAPAADLPEDLVARREFSTDHSVTRQPRHKTFHPAPQSLHG